MSKSLTSSCERKCRNHQKSQAIKKVFVEREVGLRCMFVGVTGTCDPTKQGSFVTGPRGQGNSPSFVVVGLQNSLVKNPVDSVCTTCPTILLMVGTLLLYIME